MQCSTLRSSIIWTSRLTSLVAIDVTPSRPLNDGLNSARVLNLPDGWDYDKVFGEQSAPRFDQHAQALPPPAPRRLRLCRRPLP
jgi:hypothetical protein